MRFKERRGPPYVIDAVIITGSLEIDELLFHGIEIVGLVTEHISKKLSALMQHCDFVWLSVHEHLLDETSVGILVINEAGAIHIVRQAERMNVQGCIMAKSLLKKMLD